LSTKAIRKKGMEIFATPFNSFDGHGDGPVNPFDPASPGGRPTIQGNMLRINGLDSQSCNECHSVLSHRVIPGTFTVGGVGGLSASAFPDVTKFDLTDQDNDGVANINGRAINPPFVFGSGGVELLAKEMTVDLQKIKAKAQANPGTVFQLVTKGVSFGKIVYHPLTGFDYSAVEGIDDSLVVQPFGRKGNNSTIREFDIGALQFHQGMQPQEIVGAGVDDDGDGVADEILVGELSALHIFGVASDRPIRVAENDPAVELGEKLFDTEGCATCHVPVLHTSSPTLPIAFPEVEEDPWANVFFKIDLVNGRPGFEPNALGGAEITLYSDLKRHDMGPDLAETTGDPLDPFFVTPRLWGVADTAPYLHDGRAYTIRQAIEMHGGEAQFATINFANLTPSFQKAMLIFLNSLRVPKAPNADIMVNFSIP